MMSKALKKLIFQKSVRGVVGVLLVVPTVVFGFQRLLSPTVKVQQLASVLHARALALALNMYAEDADDIYPNVRNIKSLKVVTYPYVKSKDNWNTANPKSEFRFNFSVGGVSTKEIKNPEATVLFYESKAWADGQRAVSFADGKGGPLGAHDWAKKTMSLIAYYPKVAKPLPEKTGSSWKDDS